MTGLEERLGTIAFDRWKFSIQTAMDLDQLMLVVSGYRSGWTPTQLSLLAANVAQPIEASRAEVQFNGPADQYALLREMALTLTFAATRLRYLQALKASGPL